MLLVSVESASPDANHMRGSSETVANFDGLQRHCISTRLKQQKDEIFSNGSKTGGAMITRPDNRTHEHAAYTMHSNPLRLFFSIIVASTVCLVGCSGSMPSADPSGGSPALKAGRVGIYIYRDASPKAGATMEISIDGLPLGRTAPMTHVYLEVPSGRHTLVSKASNVDTLVLDSEPGRTYYVFQEAGMGTYWATGKLHLVDERIGRPKVLQSWAITIPIAPDVAGDKGK